MKRGATPNQKKSAEFLSAIVIALIGLGFGFTLAYGLDQQLKNEADYAQHP